MYNYSCSKKRRKKTLILLQHQIRNDLLNTCRQNLSDCHQNIMYISFCVIPRTRAAPSKWYFIDGKLQQHELWFILAWSNMWRKRSIWAEGWAFILINVFFWWRFPVVLNLWSLEKFTDSGVYFGLSAVISKNFTRFFIMRCDFLLHE